MRIGIDASNLRSGGTTTYLTELLRAADPSEFGIERVIVWGGSAVLGRLDERDWLEKAPQPQLEQAVNPWADRRHLRRALWQRLQLRRLACERECDLLFVPGGMDNSGFHPFVTMSHNMLPFNAREAARYGWSLSRLRLLALRALQMRTFRRAQGMIFLSEDARQAISADVGIARSKSVVIPHGVGASFCLPPRPQRPISDCSAQAPYRILYVSTVDVYKHQWHVIDAVARLHGAGLPVTLELAGPAYGAGAQRLARTLRELGHRGEFVRCHGAIPYAELHALYARADLKVFASSCENLPIILIEAMAAGLPIACSDRSPMPAVLGSAGVYFDPERPEQIVAALRTLIESPGLRAEKAAEARERARHYSWSRCAHETFAYLAEVARAHALSP